jgi:hypothetical protein
MSEKPKEPRRNLPDVLEFDFAEEPQKPAPYAPVVIQPDPTPADKKEKKAAAAKDPAIATFSVTTQPQPEKKTMPSITPPNVNDFRRNAERQAREQKSATALLSGVAYSIIGGIVFVALLAGFGGYVLWKQIKNQSVTVAQIEAKFDGEVRVLQENLHRTQEELAVQQALLKQQQETTNRLAALSEETASALRTERAIRARETAGLQQRVRRLENR